MAKRVDLLRESANPPLRIACEALAKSDFFDWLASHLEPGQDRADDAFDRRDIAESQLRVSPENFADPPGGETGLLLEP